MKVSKTKDYSIPVCVKRFIQIQVLLSIFVSANLVLNVPSSMSSSFSWPLLVSSNSNDGYYYDAKMTHCDGWGGPIYDWVQYTLPVNTLVRSFLLFQREDCCAFRNGY